MSVIFLFAGPPDSFLIFNGSLVEFKGLPPTYSEKVKNGTFNGMNLAYMTNGPNHWYFAKIMSNNSYDAVGPSEMFPYLVPDINCYPSPPRAIEHVSFASTGGWFRRYTNGTVRWGANPPMPHSFNEIIGWLRSNYPNGAENLIKFLAFGCGDDYIGILTNGVVIYEDTLPQHIIDKINSRTRDEWTLGIHTTLCQYNRDLYYLHWTRGNKVEFDYNMANTEISQIVQKVIAGAGKNHQSEMMMQMMQYQLAIRRNRWL